MFQYGFKLFRYTVSIWCQSPEPVIPDVSLEIQCGYQ
jgi:hypothetical protein